MIEQENFFEQQYVGRYIYANFCHSDNARAQSVGPRETVVAASGVFRDVCSEEPPYHASEELWERLKQGHEGA